MRVDHPRAAASSLAFGCRAARLRDVRALLMRQTVAARRSAPLLGRWSPPGQSAAEAVAGAKAAAARRSGRLWRRRRRMDAEVIRHPVNRPGMGGVATASGDLDVR